VTADPGNVYGRILADMQAIWGEMASAMLRKRMRDINADATRLTAEDLRRVVSLLQEKTLPSILGLEGAELKAKLWISWMDNGEA